MDMTNKIWVPGGPEWRTPVLDEWLDELRRHHIQASIEWIGGGLTVLEIPLSEDGTRYVWLGWDEAEPEGRLCEPVHADEWGPTADGVIGGCIYRKPEPSEDYGYWGNLTDEPVNGDPTAAVERILKQAMFYDETQMEEW